MAQLAITLKLRVDYSAQIPVLVPSHEKLAKRQIVQIVNWASTEFEHAA